MLGEILGAVGGLLGLSQQDKINDQNLDLAKHSVEYRVKDAMKAGIHPLAALGAPTISSGAMVGDFGGTMSSMGQGLDRALEAGRSTTGRGGDLALELLKSQIDGQNIDNDIKRTELASRVRRSVVGAGVAPAVPEPGPNTARGADIGGQFFPLPGGITWQSGPNATAEEWERQYGDMSQELYGTVRFLDDVARNVGRLNDWSYREYDKRGVARPDWGTDLIQQILGINPAF